MLLAIPVAMPPIVMRARRRYAAAGQNGNEQQQQCRFDESGHDVGDVWLMTPNQRAGVDLKRLWIANMCVRM
jgi:hypothetical protein